jgi:hypothetical protein
MVGAGGGRFSERGGVASRPTFGTYRGLGWCWLVGAVSCVEELEEELLGGARFGESGRAGSDADRDEV